MNKLILLLFWGMMGDCWGMDHTELGQEMHKAAEMAAEKTDREFNLYYFSVQKKDLRTLYHLIIQLELKCKGAKNKATLESITGDFKSILLSYLNKDTPLTTEEQISLLKGEIELLKIEIINLKKEIAR